MENNIKEIIEKMSLEDKIAFCTGKNLWQTKDFEKYGIPSLFMSDGPHGLRKQNLSKGVEMLKLNDSEPATCFPSAVTTASSWDPELLEKVGNAIGGEARALGVGLVLGPGANIKRNPLCGRNFEYFSEDPFLAGKLAAGFIRGVQSQGIGTSLKHFACNSQELDRFISDGVVSERTLREIYLSGFEIAVKEGKPATIMCAYPKLNGEHCSDSKKLLTDILRSEWGFDGMVVTDWGAMNDRIKGFQAGCDLNMPGGSKYMEKEVKEAVLSGKLDEKYIDASVERILKLVFKAQLAVNDKSDWKDADHRLAVEAATKGAVLLKNENGVLPVDSKEKLAIVGYMAKDMRFQGAGSSHINPTFKTNPIDYFDGASYAQGCMEDGSTNDELLREAIETSKNADKVIIFAGLPGNYECEGYDRESMKMPEGHLRMIDEIAKCNPNTVVVLLCGSVVECPWADSVRGILYMGLPGQGGGEAAAKLLKGEVNPSGKLAESWPYKYEDVPSSEIFAKTKDALYEEGIYAGYRYYEKAGLPVRFPFGFGLSYTSFEYSDLSVKGRRVSLKVTNTGKSYGEEVVALYIGRKQDGIHRPLRELKRFTKVALASGETKEVEFELDERCFAVWDNGWKVEKGSYSITVGKLSCEVEIDGETISKTDEKSWYNLVKGKPNLESFENELGRHYVKPVLEKGRFTMDNTVEEMKDFSLIMKLVYNVIEKMLAKQYGGKDNPEFKMMLKSSAGSPIRTMIISSGLRGGLFEGLLEIANGHFFKGIGKIL